MGKNIYQQLDSPLARTPQLPPDNFLSGVSQNGFRIVGQSNLIAAGLTADSLVVGIHISDDYDAGNLTHYKLPVYLERLELTFTCIGAFTAPITAGRRLEIGMQTNPGSDLTFTGGLDLSVVEKMFGSNSQPATLPRPIDGADQCQIADTGALTPSDSISPSLIGLLPLMHAGTAGAVVNKTWVFDAEEATPFALSDRSVLVVRTPVSQAMDAAGTWQLTLEADFQYLPSSFYVAP